MSDMPTVGFIGIGAMGWHMSANLCRAGYRLVVYDLDRERMSQFAQEFEAEAADSLAVLGAAAEVVITMLPNGGDVRHVMLEAEQGGLVPHLTPGTVIADMSSSAPVGTRELGAALREKQLALIDAPVSGGTRGAEAATLTIMIGGDEAAAIERATPLFEVIGGNLFHTGPLGTGHAMKSLNNFVGATNFTAVSEALLVGQKFGLDPAKMIDIINVSTGRNYASEQHVKVQVLPRAFAAGFKLGLMAKDVGIAGDLAEAIGVEAPVSRLIRELWRDASDNLGADEDFTAAIQNWETKNGYAIDATASDED